MSEPLGIDDFDSFFRELNEGHEPFPWQSRLARKVCEERKWPGCLDLPTAAGKTAVLEIAVFHLAMEAQRGIERRAPVRIAFVVDRRLIVDQAEERAQKMVAALAGASPAGTVGRVAEKLRGLSGESNPLRCFKLRGGVPQEREWARTPTQPTILLSTVDQVGSRLLFRGYGVSDSMKPVHAGLLGSDCLFFLDEAHLSEPFRQTLGWVSRYRRDPWSEVEPGPWGFVELSATPGGGETERFGLDPDTDGANDVLQARFGASKLAQLQEASGHLDHFYAEQALGLVNSERKKILVAVNRVGLARSIFGKIEKEAGLLLTGRVREADRTRIVAKLKERLTGDRETIVVATQCIEAGADLDFDGLVTQLAPLDSLRQRFGRLNRSGRPIAAAAIIAGSKEEIKGKKPDPVYGDRGPKTWQYLSELAGTGGTVDFGVYAMREKLDGDRVKDCACDRPDAPVMMPAYVDLWMCTSPVPEVDPDVPLFLHGPQAGPADVLLVWRADLRAVDLARRENEAGKDLEELFDLVPPRTGETLGLPIWKVRAWLAGERAEAAAVSDLEGIGDSDGSAGRTERPVFRWAGAENDRTGVVFGEAIRPGDLIIVPAEYGGCDEWGWSPESTEQVRDVADEVAAAYWGRGVALRVQRDVLRDALGREPVEGEAEEPEARSNDVWHRVQPLLEDCEDDAGQLVAVLLEVEGLPELWRNALGKINRKVRLFWYNRDSPRDGAVLVGQPDKAKAHEVASTASDEAGSFSSSRHNLANHTRHVTEIARAFADTCGLRPEVQGAIELAAEFHDSGKGDRRFQAYLKNGPLTGAVLAKSERGWQGPSKERRIRTEAGLPEKWRHEALSVRLAAADTRLAEAGTDLDRELVLWLIGTHHGHGRPFYPHDDPLDAVDREIEDADGSARLVPGDTGPQRLDFDWRGMDWTDLFRRLTRRYGPWELARMEAILRLADHRGSED